MDESDKIIKQFFEALPQDIKQFVITATWKNDVAAIAKKYALNEEKQRMLEMEVLMLLIGMENPEELAANITNEIGVLDSIARIIAEDIYKVIPQNILLHSKGVVETIDNPPAAQTTPKPALGIPVGYRPGPAASATVPSYGVNPMRPVSAATPPAPATPPAEYHDPMPITITSEPEVKPMIDSRLMGKTSMPAQQVNMTPKAGIKAVDKALTDGEKYVGPDPYREQPET